MRRHHNRRLLSLQFSLRSLLLIGIAVGTWAGVAGPRIARAIQEWTTPAPAPFCAVTPVEHSNENQSGYYESAETPLR